MWPKVIAQLFELLPHVSRLLPVADKLLASKAASERANEAALAAMAEGVRGDLGQVTKAHAGLYRQLQEQSAQITLVGDEVKETRLSIENYVGRVETLEKQLTSLGWWITAGVSLLLVLVIMVIVLLIHLLRQH